MESVFSFVVGLLTAALSLLGFVQQHPELPQASKDQAQQVAQQAITQATGMLANGQVQQTAPPTISQSSKEIRIQLVNNVTGLPVANHSVYVAHVLLCKPGGSCPDEVIFRGETNSSGEFSIQHSLLRNEKLVLDGYEIVGPIRPCDKKSVSAELCYPHPEKDLFDKYSPDRGGVMTVYVNPIGQQTSSAQVAFVHPSDGYAFTYDSSKLEARATSATEFPSGTGLLPSSAVFSGGGYGQEAEILTYRGSIDAAQEAFIGAYRQYYSPQVLGTENVTINGNQARVVRYKVGPTYPEAKVYLIAYRPNEPRTIVATGDYNVVSSIKSR